ncbi:FAD-dependent thymidylate synthase [Candidatus Similichlamydia epinepheli]|uniref:FAD-dependent thymidylate synthase n=1 Tax=Candidatus Similichlamydia epinepheli TaxID=1903953 RepID=UPI000D3D9D3B|nr:FAD-dependent thymidylate synthase [Candidatus Similichlamydia epinepheli]
MDDQIESLLGKKLPVLDHGFVRLIDFMGSDEFVANCTRLESDELDRFSNEERIDWCFRTSNLSPLEQACVVFQIRLPIYVMGQLVRHRTAKLNSFSARYAKVNHQFHELDIKDLRMQGDLNKQVGQGSLEGDFAKNCVKSIQEASEQGYRRYLSLMEMGLCREQARIILPQNAYTTIFWKMDLRNLFHFLRLRLGKDAQKEIQFFSQQIAYCVTCLFPICWKSFQDNHLKKVHFTLSELKLLAIFKNCLICSYSNSA